VQLLDSIPVALVAGGIYVTGWLFEVNSLQQEAVTDLEARTSVVESKQARDASDLVEIRAQLDRIEIFLRGGGEYE
jgi:hypothetical protein